MKFIFVILCIFASIYGIKTAKISPEFNLAIDTENFKEIRIPYDVWRKIITRSYRPGGKLPENSNEDYSQENYADSGENVGDGGDSSSFMSNQVLHEVVINVMVPPENDQENPEVENMQQIIVPVLEDVSVVEPEEPVKPQKPVKDKPQKPVKDKPTSAVVAQGADEAGSPVASPPASVVVQTTRLPCNCVKGICGCCATIFSQKGCANVGFLPEEFAFEMKMTMNGNTIARRKMPVSDPPPICFNPRRAPFVEVCAQLSKIHFKNRNVHACVDLDANIGGFEIFEWNFNCLRFGAQGLATGISPQKIKKPQSKPESSGLFALFGGGGGGGGSDDDDDDEEGGIFEEFLEDITSFTK